MVVIAVLAFVVTPRFSLLQGFDEIAYRDSVVATLQFARKAAIAQRRVVNVTVGGNDVTLEIQQNVPELAAGTWVALALPSADGRCAGATNKVCHPNNVLLAPDGTITFDAQGRVTGGAGNYTITGATNAVTITVETETGYVH